MPIEPQNKPNYESNAYKSMTSAWTVVSDVSGGTARMRECSATYLPQEPAERPESYNRRLARSVFFNAFNRILDALVGMVHKADPELGDDVPEEIKKHLENIDLAGSHLDPFLKELFTDAVRDGHAFILVDMQPALPANATRADEIAQGRRPYWVKYKANQAKNWRTTVVNGETILSQITFEEKTNESDGEYGEKEVCRYRVFKLESGLVKWALYRKVVQVGTKEETFIEEGSGTVNNQTRIPVAVVYGNRLGMLVSSPPLLDLAYLNIAHWQEYSDYRNILHIAQVPLLARIGANQDQQKVEIGVGSTLDVETGGDVKWIEIHGNGVTAARTELQDIEQRMALMGLSMLSQKADSNVTATEIRSNNLQESSDLATMARSEQDGAEMALEFHAKYLNLPSGGSLKLGVAESDVVLDAVMVTAVSNLVSKGQLTLETFLNLLQRGLPGVELQDELKKLEAEAVKSAANGPNVAKAGIQGAPPGIKDLFGAQPKANGALV